MAIIHKSVQHLRTPELVSQIRKIPGLVGLWLFNEGAGWARDSVGTNHGVLSAGMSHRIDEERGRGVGNASINEWVDIKPMFSGVSEFTYGFWIKPRVDTSGDMAGKWNAFSNPGESKQLLIRNADAQFFVRNVADSLETSASAGKNITLDNWHLVLCEATGSNLRSSVDLVFGSDVSFSGPYIPSSTDNWALVGRGHNSFIRAEWGMAFSFNRILTDEEKQKIYEDSYGFFIEPRRRWVPVVIQGGAGATVSPDNATHGHIADNATLSQNHILILANSSHGHSAEQTILTQSHLLTIADSLHSHVADNAGLSQGHILALDGSTHGHIADQATLTQSHILATDSALHAHAADSVALDQTHILAVADALHAHAADNVSLTVAGALDIANSIHTHSADQIALTQLHILATANALHGHSADNVTLISGLTLDITDAVHGHTAGQVTLQQAHILAIVNASHGHTAEQATLGVDLIIQPSSHAHTADIVSLDPGLGLAIQDAIHAHQANNLTLNQQHILVISDALHSHLAQNATISEGAFTISTFPARTITVVGKSRTITVVAGNRTINA